MTLAAAKLVDRRGYKTYYWGKKDLLGEINNYSWGATLEAAVTFSVRKAINYYAVVFHEGALQGIAQALIEVQLTFAARQFVAYGKWALQTVL